MLTRNRQDYSERMESGQSKSRRSRLSPAKRRRAPQVEVDYCPRASLRSPWATVYRPPKGGGLSARAVAARFGLNYCQGLDTKGTKNRFEGQQNGVERLKSRLIWTAAAIHEPTVLNGQ